MHANITPLWPGRFFLILMLSAASSVGAQADANRRHEQWVADAQSACAPYRGNKLTLVVPTKPGGGFDLMGRALSPFLEKHSGMSVALANVTGSKGMQAIQTVANSSASRPAIGLIDLGSFPTQMIETPSKVSMAGIIGLGVMSTDRTVWVSRQPLDWTTAKNRVLTGTTISSPYLKLTVPGQLLGLNMKPIYGYEGTNEAWLAMLRGEVDVSTISDYSIKRFLATGVQASVGLTLTEGPHPDFPGVPFLAGAGGFLDIRTKGMPAAERRRIMDAGSLTVMLAAQARTVVASARLNLPMQACLRNATAAALFDPALAQAAERQKFGLAPESHVGAQATLKKMDQALKDNQAYFASITASMKESR